MTTSRALGEVLDGVRAVLLDFDGPVCDVYAGYPAGDVARRVIDALGIDEPEDITDPLVILHRAADHSSQLEALRADDVLRAAELDAVRSSAPTPGAVDVLAACERVELPVAIVSNNSEPAIRRYLELHHLERYVRAIAGRPAGRPDRMKPSPYLLDVGAQALGVPADDVVLIGDSTTDVEAAAQANMRVIGYANKPGKANRLTEAGASVVVDDMRELSRALVAAAAV